MLSICTASGMPQETLKVWQKEILFLPSVICKNVSLPYCRKQQNRCRENKIWFSVKLSHPVINMSNTHFWPLTFTASEDALQDLCPGDQLWPSDWEQEGWRNRPQWVCHPYERRSQRRLPTGRWQTHKPACCGTFQPAESNAESAGAA